MKGSYIWGAAFLLLYCGHALSYRALNGAFGGAVSGQAVLVISIATLIGLVLLVIAHIATRDEVIRRFALEAGAISGAAVGALSYGLSAFDISAPALSAHLWAVAISVFLFVYGTRTWLAKL